MNADPRHTDQSSEQPSEQQFEQQLKRGPGDRPGDGSGERTSVGKESGPRPGAPVAPHTAESDAVAARRLADAPMVIVTGMSGAGRTTTANALEDLGWLVVDNLPPQLLAQLAELRDQAVARDPQVSTRKVAVVVDVRSQGFFPHLQAAMTAMADAGERPSLVFLDATDEALVRRFESVRRPHPLQGDGRLLDGIQRERDTLFELRSSADVVIDSSGLNVHQLTAKVTALFSGSGGAQLRVAIMSFGFKYGLPLDGDIVFDMRFLPNPYWVPHLRALSGRDVAVADYVGRQPGAAEFLDRAEAVLETMIDGYVREGRRYVTVAVGCTGGKHRSVATAEALSARLGATDHVDTFVVHRDLGRE